MTSFFSQSTQSLDVDPAVVQLDADMLDRPLLPSSIHQNRHRRARAERAQSSSYGFGPVVGAADVHRLVGDYAAARAP